MRRTSLRDGQRHQEESIPSGRTPARPSHSPDRRPTPPNALSPELLADLRDRDESLTFAGPWKLEPVPGLPGAVAVLRESESLEDGDEPEAIFLEEETGQICIAILPGVEREPLYHPQEDRDEDGPLGGGFPVITIHGEQSSKVRGWLRHYHPAIVRDIGTVELLNRSPSAHAAVLEAGGGGALERIGRELAARRR